MRHPASRCSFWRVLLRFASRLLLQARTTMDGESTPVLPRQKDVTIGRATGRDLSTEERKIRGFLNRLLHRHLGDPSSRGQAGARCGRRAENPRWTRFPGCSPPRSLAGYATNHRPGSTPGGSQSRETEFYIDNLLVRTHFIIVMIRWTGLAPWEFECPSPGSLTFTFLVHRAHAGAWRCIATCGGVPCRLAAKRPSASTLEQAGR